MPLSFITSLLGTGTASVGGGDQSTNSDTNTSSNTNTSSTASGTQSKTLTPYQTAIQAPLFNYVQNVLTPAGAEAAVAPYTAASRDATNSQYAGLSQMLQQQFLSTGNGQSGKYGSALLQGNLQREGALNQVDLTGQEEAAALPMQASTLASQLLGQNFGQTTSGATTGTSATTGSSSTKSSTSGFNFSL